MLGSILGPQIMTNSHMTHVCIHQNRTKIIDTVAGLDVLWVSSSWPNVQGLRLCLTSHEN